MPGPLHGVTIIELAGIGPGPFAGMMLSDMGARIIRVDRVGEGRETDAAAAARNAMNRGRESIQIDTKTAEGRDIVLDLFEKADAVIEGFRPGVVERLGIGPEQALARNPKIVYGRMTGWGQDGPWASTAGHDGVYIAISGALAPIGDPDRPPVPPLNMLGDYGGGGMFLAFGIACALFETGISGKGQVVDAAIIDGAAALSVSVRQQFANGAYPGRGANRLDQGAPNYNVYETSDGGYMAIGPLEAKFSKEFFDILGIAADDELRTKLDDPAAWPGLKERLRGIFTTKTRDEWSAIFDGTDACVAPVLNAEEAERHPHNIARNGFVDFGGVQQQAPAPRFGRTKPELTIPAPLNGADTRTILTSLGRDDAAIDKLLEAGVIGSA